MQFHYGQRVKCVKPVDGNGWIVGKTGTICAIATRPTRPGVDFDEAGMPGNPNLHGDWCDDGCYVNKGVWNCPIDALIPLELCTAIGVDDLI